MIRKFPRRNFVVLNRLQPTLVLLVLNASAQLSVRHIGNNLRSGGARELLSGDDRTAADDYEAAD